MNPIERMRGELAARFPASAIDLDAPVDPSGPWSLTAARPGHRPIVVEWRPGRGFGLSTPGADDYGAGPDEVITSSRMATERIDHLIRSGEGTDPGRPVGLDDLRLSVWMTQADFASALGIDQANISRAERGRGLRLATLNGIVAAMGGRLEVRAKFPGRPPRPLIFSGSANLSKPGSRRQKAKGKRDQPPSE